MFESERMPAFSEEFKEEMNAALQEFMYGKTKGKFNWYWNLVKKWPQYLLDPKEREWMHDHVQAEHHNTGRIRKRISKKIRLLSFLEKMDDIADHLDKPGKYLGEERYSLEDKDFFEWYEKFPLKIYRGMLVSKDYVDGEWIADFENIPEGVKAGEYADFTLDLNTAIRFTQPDWGHVTTWKREKDRNG